MTYTQNFVVEGIIPDDTDPVVKIRAVNFNPSSALSVDTTLPITLSKNSNTNDYQGNRDKSTDCKSKRYCHFNSPSRRSIKRFGTVYQLAKADEPELITEGIKIFTISETNTLLLFKYGELVAKQLK